jgi:hypothetical protein
MRPEYHSPESRRRQRATEQAKRHRWRDAGCCPHCGIPTERYVYCMVYRKYNMKNQTRRRRAAARLKTAA